VYLWERGRSNHD